MLPPGVVYIYHTFIIHNPYLYATSCALHATRSHVCMHRRHVHWLHHPLLSSASCTCGNSRQLSIFVIGASIGRGGYYDLFLLILAVAICQSLQHILPADPPCLSPPSSSCRSLQQMLPTTASPASTRTRIRYMYVVTHVVSLNINMHMHENRAICRSVA